MKKKIILAAAHFQRFEWVCEERGFERVILVQNVIPDATDRCNM